MIDQNIKIKDRFGESFLALKTLRQRLVRAAFDNTNTQSMNRWEVCSDAGFSDATLEF